MKLKRKFLQAVKADLAKKSGICDFFGLTSGALFSWCAHFRRIMCTVRHKKVSAHTEGKALSLARRTVGQTSEVNDLDPTQRVLKSQMSLQLIGAEISSVFTFSKLGIFCSCLLPVVLIQSALESPDNCASSGGSNLGIRSLGAELVSAPKSCKLI